MKMIETDFINPKPMRRKSLLTSVDWLTIFIYMLLVAMGWFSIYAAEYEGMKTRVFDLSSNHGKQMTWIYRLACVRICCADY